MRGIVEEQISVWEDRVKGCMVSEIKSFSMKNFGLPTLTTSHAPTTTDDNNNRDNRRGRSTTPRRRIDEQHIDDRRRDTSHEQRHTTTTTMTTTATTNTTGLCEKIACVAGRPDPFSKVKAQDFLAVAESYYGAVWSCPPTDSLPWVDQRVVKPAGKRHTRTLLLNFVG